MRVLAAASPNSFLTGEAILDACRTGANALGAPNNQAFQQDCNLIVGGVLVSPEGSAQALRDLTPDQIDAENQVRIRSASLVVGLLRDRLQQLKSGGAASADELSFGPLNVHFNARYATGDADPTLLTPGYDSDGWAVVGGVDYRFTDQLIAGVALNYASGSSDFALNRGQLDLDSLGVALYGTWNLPNGFVIDGLASYAETDYNLNRHISYSIAGQNADQIARSDQDAEVWNFNLGAGYTHYVDSWAITPSLRLNFLQNQVSGFVERMSAPTGVGGSMALAMDGQTYTSFTSDLGVQITRAISTGFGVLVPQLRVGWVHEFDNDAKLIGARFVNDITSTLFGVLTAEPVRDYADVSLGLSAQFANGRSAFLSYNTLLGYTDTTYHAINAGFRLEF